MLVEEPRRELFRLFNNTTPLSRELFSSRLGGVWWKNSRQKRAKDEGKKKREEKGGGEKKSKDLATKLCHSTVPRFLPTTFINYPLFVACQTLLVCPTTGSRGGFLFQQRNALASCPYLRIFLPRPGYSSVSRLVSLGRVGQFVVLLFKQA